MSEDIRSAVRDVYARTARQTPASGCGCGCGCGGGASQSETLGYERSELAAIPSEADLGLGCGNPASLAALQPGETVVDLGSGGGIDCFLAARRVSPGGRVIGVDMTPEMIDRSRAAARKGGFQNVEFRLGEIENLPVADGAADVVISNCVINLSPNKPQVWREIARVLKPGGRVAVSDLALMKPLPAAIVESVEALVGCVAGAVLMSETERMAREAGLEDIVLESKSAYIDGMVDWQDPLYQKIIKDLPAGAKPSDYITSLEITARKPGGECCGSECCSQAEPS